ncbi:ParB family protein [Serratia ureilytica]|uniref:ParB family protein n=1 Tax=Serratia ureilytica TaxID=300181 RepID=UPI0019D07CAB|nr:ParB family protein [Serratia ureilytica]MBN5215760.1 ParB family protein [Serratia ureilytica]
MTRPKTKILDLNSALLQQGKTAVGTGAATSTVSALPVSEMPMVLTLDEVVPFPDNPRTSRNPRYDGIKASIRARGLDTVPKITLDPERPELGYFFSDGGNTRYAILSELWQETGDERFYRFSCVFKPWPGRLSCVIGHLAENEVRGDLSFIEKAIGIRQAREIYETQLGKSVTLRELSALLTEEGYPVHYSSISRMEDTVLYLYPYMPHLLESGLGRPQIQSLLALRTHAESTWQKHDITQNSTETFDSVFSTACRHFDSPDAYSLEMFRDELIGALITALPHPSLNYDRWLLELDPKEQNRRKHLGEPPPLPAMPLAAQAPENPLPNTVETQVVPPPLLDSALSETAGEHDDLSGTPPANEMAPSRTKPRVETQPDLYGAPPVLSGDIEHESGADEAHTDSLPPALLSALPAGGAGEDEASPPAELAPTVSDVAFADTGIEPVTALWAIPVLQDDIEHLQGMAFRLAFELAEVAGCEAEVQADKSGLHAAGFGLAGSSASRFTALLLSLAGIPSASEERCSLVDACIGSDNPADWPVLDDIHTVKLMRLIRVLRRLRELQRDLPATEETA